MILLNLKHKGKSTGVRFPTTVDEVNQLLDFAQATVTGEVDG